MLQAGQTAFLLGVPRSGTTLLRVMLAGHPRIFSPPEMLLAPFETMRAICKTLGPSPITTCRASGFVEIRTRAR